jgi:hypothetical protein
MVQPPELLPIPKVPLQLIHHWGTSVWAAQWQAWCAPALSSARRVASGTLQRRVDLAELRMGAAARRVARESVRRQFRNCGAPEDLPEHFREEH